MLYTKRGERMTKKEILLDSLIDGGDYGECETQIKECFKSAEVDISVKELRKLISEMLVERLIRTNATWKNEHGETPYVITSKGKELWNKNKSC